MKTSSTAQGRFIKSRVGGSKNVCLPPAPALNRLGIDIIKSVYPQSACRNDPYFYDLPTNKTGVRSSRLPPRIVLCPRR
jgi:hypothetical protein